MLGLLFFLGGCGLCGVSGIFSFSLFIGWDCFRMCLFLSCLFSCYWLGLLADWLLFIVCCCCWFCVYFLGVVVLFVEEVLKYWFVYMCVFLLL